MTLKSAGSSLVLTSFCVLATLVLAVAPLTLLDRPAPRRIRLALPPPTTPLPSQRPSLEQRFYGITPDSMILYTPPGFVRPTVLKLEREK